MELRHPGSSCPPPPNSSFPLLYSSILLLSIGLYSSTLLQGRAAAEGGYLLSCGSSSSVTVDTRIFISDNIKTGFFGRTGSPKPIRNPHWTPGLSKLYGTATAFLSACTYEFGELSPGLHFIRLHFSPFSDGAYNLSSRLASFQVTAMGGSILLLVSEPSAAGVTVVKEFLLWLPEARLDITFTPSASIPGAFAYANAIEVFMASGKYMNSTTPTMIGHPAFSTVDWGKPALETMFRVNTGGLRVDDTLHRTWTEEQKYLYPTGTAESAENVSASSPIAYPSGGELTADFAPKSVYETAVQVKQGTHQGNASWDFPVPSGYRYLLRLHFCDFVSATADALHFNIYVNNHTAFTDLHPADRTGRQPRVPFYLDFAVDVVDSLGIRLAVGPSSNSTGSARNIAILNGLEIWKVSDSNGSFDTWAASVAANGGSSRNKRLIIKIPLAVAALALIVASGIVFFLLRRGKKKANEPPQKHVQGTTPTRRGGEGSALRSIPGTPTITPRSPVDFHFNLHISLDELAAATNGFDEALVIGSGGFGKVYKGVLRDGRAVAVKRASTSSKQGAPQFENEITLLSRIRHRHLVSLIGFSNENSEMILVYEYMEKGSLRDRLYGSGSVPLSWKERLEICIGAAKGLHYLHAGFPVTIIHRDIKSSNILLGRTYVAKVSDFGLSKVNPSEEHRHVSTAVRGSFGYMDPEYFKSQQLTDKSDVYSFGVVLFEVLCGRPAIDQAAPMDQVNLAEWAAECEQRGALEEIVDVRLRGEIEPLSLRKFGETAAKCLAELGADRPSIASVLWSLQYVKQLQDTGGVGRREPFEDSVAVDSQLPSFVAGDQTQLIDRGWFRSEDGDESGASTHVFSQSTTSADR